MSMTHPKLAGVPRYITAELYNQVSDGVGNVGCELRRFSTGSWGWMGACKLACPGLPGHRMQVNVQLVIIGSKDWPDEPAPEA